MQSMPRLEIIPRQIQSCVNTIDRREKIKTLIKSWLPVADETVAYSKRKLVPLKGLPADRQGTHRMGVLSREVTVVLQVG